jgi:hypothetical protein
MNQEAIGSAEQIVNSLLTFTDHMVHNRPGVVFPDEKSVTGVRWVSATWRLQEDGKKTVFEKREVGKKTIEVPLGTLWADNTVRDENRRKVGEFRKPGIFPEVAVWLYRQAVEIWKSDNKFSAHWASHAYGEDRRDLKVILAALMLVQSRKGDPVKGEGDEETFFDDDYRDVGEAMMLLYSQETGKKKDGKKTFEKKGGNWFSPKMILRVHKVLSMPEIIAINHELGFSNSVRNRYLGRWSKAVRKWLEYRERNPRLLKGIVKDGQASIVRDLCRKSHYKPQSPDFFKTLEWKQHQAKLGYRTMAIGQDVEVESWKGMTEEQVCERIVRDRVNYKRVVRLLPKEVGLTQAVMAATIEADGLSDKDLIILSPSLEGMGLLEDPSIRKRWEKAMKAAKDMRAANIALRVKSKEAREKLQKSADEAVQEAVKEAVRNVRIYFFVDRSSSMEGAIEAAKQHLPKILVGFPPEQVHVAVFNSVGQEVTIKHQSAAGIENAFKGITARGGTDHGQGIRALQRYRPKPDEDVLFIFVGDEQDNSFEAAVRQSGLNPMAFGFIRVVSPQWRDTGEAVRRTARVLEIPCFMIDERTFQDPYAIPQTVRALVAATPVNYAKVQPAPRVSLADKILETKLLEKPAWAA